MDTLARSENKPFETPEKALAVALKLAIKAKEKYNVPYRESIGVILHWLNACQRYGVIIEGWSLPHDVRWYRLRKCFGLCVGCGRQPAKVDRTLCEDCTNRRKERRERRKKNY